MFYYFYQVCVAVFLAQGVSVPLLLALSGWLWWRQNRRLEDLRAESEVSTPKPSKGAAPRDLPELILKSLPVLTPLNCANCGGSVLLRETETFCPYCETRAAAPEDYAAASALKTEVKKIYASAVRHWRVANVLTFRPARWFFVLMIFAEPFVLFPVVLVGSNLFRDTWADRALKASGETASFFLMLAAFLGFVVWMVVFICLAALAKSLRRNLPVVPVFEERVRRSETARCQACGGAIEYDAGALACACAYCNVENFRVRFARRERARSEQQRTQTKSALFGATEVIEEFVGTFFFVLLILASASVLFVVVYALKNR
jgi:Zn finger protein HypA/HybF involved in hydrogenase expression